MFFIFIFRKPFIFILFFWAGIQTDCILDCLIVFLFWIALECWSHGWCYRQWADCRVHWEERSEFFLNLFHFSFGMINSLEHAVCWFSYSFGWFSHWWLLHSPISLDGFWFHSQMYVGRSNTYTYIYSWNIEPSIWYLDL